MINALKSKIPRAISDAPLKLNQAALRAARHGPPYCALDDLAGELPPAVLREMAAAEVDR